MLDTLFASVISTTVNWQAIILCTLSSLILGAAAAAIYCYKNTYTKSFVVTLALLPAMVQIVIMLVNGNLGAGVAVMGAFSLVRFRSVPGSAREIGSLFFAMALGLATGMGYLGYAVLFLLLIGIANILLYSTSFAAPKLIDRELKITIPESLDYEGVFDDLFEKYTTRHELLHVKTSNMGSLYELCYLVRLKDTGINKNFLDEIRCRNGNLNITCGRLSTVRDEL
ncbi:DUF4956 domain-containing protein [uncultured Negativibacillus sp.]|uniref:DUF4956 domain-containing protein n=1 Tax=uncultured Negativibacillus sp. TaxID=1980696 RepID=UPI0025F674FE|nr:DUF4956 domain-containing protein [uncultured Negativibacillus sp.]